MSIRLGRLGGALVLAGALLFNAVPAAAQGIAGITLNLSPDIDYGQFCVSTPVAPLSTDWSTWDGNEPASSLAAMAADASIYLAGSNATLRDRELAKKMLDYLAAAEWPGRGQALYQLGRMHLDKRSGFHDPALAVSELEQAVALNNAGAAALLGSSYLRGEDLPRDDAASEQFLKIAAAAEDVASTLALAKLYYQRPDLQLEPGAADNYLKLGLTTLYRNIAGGNCGDLKLLGDIFADNELNGYDPVKAVAWYQAAFRTGNIDAAVELAAYHGDVRSSFYDPGAAEAYLTFASLAGRPSAMVDLGSLQLQQKTPESFATAMGWLEKAAAHGEMSAYETIVAVLQGEHGGTRDDVKAYEYLARAADLSNASYEILFKLAKAQAQGDGTPVDQATAYSNYKRAAELGDALAYVSLYDLAATGLSIPGERPLDLLRKAADQGQSDAMTRLGDAYLCGVEVERDPVIAGQWYDRAAAAGNVPVLISLAKTALAAADGGSAYLSYIERAAGAGDAEAMILLSDALRKGTGIAADPVQAKAWQDQALGNPLTRARALLTLATIAREDAVDAASGDTAMEPFLKEAAALGEPAALYELGNLYLNGNENVAADPAQSTQYFVLAAQQGHVAAMLRLAEMNISATDGGGQDSQAWLSEAVARGNVRATLLAASLVEDPEAQKLFFDKALAHVLCDPKDIVTVAKAILPVDTYKDESVSLVERAMAIGSDDPTILYQLADLIGTGLIGDARIPEAVDYLERAADLGKIEAMRELGKTYFRATTVPQDVGKALHWLLLAARVGDPDAMKELGQMVKKLGVEAVDLDGIVAALKEAATANAPGAAKVLASVLSEATAIDSRYQAEASIWLRHAAEDGDGSSMVTLSNAYALGIGVEKSDSESARWLKAAAEAGYPDAYAKYAMVLELGLGTERDPDGARFWLAKASESVPQ